MYLLGGLYMKKQPKPHEIMRKGYFGILCRTKEAYNYIFDNLSLDVNFYDYTVEDKDFEKPKFVIIQEGTIGCVFTKEMAEIYAHIKPIVNFSDFYSYTVNNT